MQDVEHAAASVGGLKRIPGSLWDIRKTTMWGWLCEGQAWTFAPVRRSETCEDVAWLVKNIVGLLTFSFISCIFIKYHWSWWLQRSQFSFLLTSITKYEEHFLFDYALKNAIIPSIIYAWGRIMKIHVKSGLNVTFLDSFSFLPMALRNLPKAFRLKEQWGEFPYLFNIFYDTEPSNVKRKINVRPKIAKFIQLSQMLIWSVSGSRLVLLPNLMK